MRGRDPEGFGAVSRAVPDLDAAIAAEADLPRGPVWGRGDDRFVTFGTAARLEFRGPSRFVDAAAAWRSLVAAADVDDTARVPGSGLVAFGSFAFADESDAVSVLIVPRVVVGRRDGVAFVTRVSGDALLDPVEQRPATATGVDEDGYVAAVARAVEAIRAGELQKVVLARDLAVAAPDLDLDAALGLLADRYRDAFTFEVDGFFGASPETLVASDGEVVTARVLAGTALRGPDPDSDAASRDALLASAKNRFEHALAVDSLILTLAPHSSDLDIGRPFALGLPNVWHLATDASARIEAGTSTLDLLSALHPTAAVAGAPREAALALIARLEPFDRGRYAGPVGWTDAGGAGEWAIGLRSAQYDGATVRAFAGAGIVAESDPETELAETGWKFAPVLEALAAAGVSVPAAPARAAAPDPVR